MTSSITDRHTDNTPCCTPLVNQIRCKRGPSTLW